MRTCEHPDTLGAYNNRKPDDAFFSSQTHTLEDVWDIAMNKRDASAASWMFERPVEEVQRACEETHLDFPDWLVDMTRRNPYDNEYLQCLRENKEGMKRYLDAVFRHQPDSDQEIPSEIFVDLRHDLHVTKNPLNINRA